MSATGLEVFDKTIHVTNKWLDEIMETLPRDRHLAWHVLRAVLRTLRDRVPVNLAVHPGAQLPLLVRGTYYEQWRPSETPQSRRKIAATREQGDQGWRDPTGRKGMIIT